MTAHLFGEGYESLSDMYASHSMIFNLAFAYLIFLCGGIYLFRDSLPDTGAQILAGATRQSNLENEFQYSAEQAVGQVLKVLSLWIYPVKGCRGIELNTSDVLETGLRYDRQVMFATKKGDGDWTFASQRGYPRMALLHTSIDPAANKLTIFYPTEAQGFPFNLIFGNTLRSQFSLPLDANLSAQRDTYRRVKVDVWGSEPETYDLSHFLPEQCKLEIFPQKGKTVTEVGLFAAVNGHERKVEGPECLKFLDTPPISKFADVFPLQLLGLASVRALNKRVEKEVPHLSIRRFRTNIVVSGTPAYDEDDWKTIVIGKQQYHIVARTPRCKVPNNDPDTGIRNRNEPDVTIRHERNIDEGAPDKGCMGMHVVPFEKFGTISVGDEILVEERTDKHKFA